jgi:hypothetical protein
MVHGHTKNKGLKIILLLYYYVITIHKVVNNVPYKICTQQGS